MPLKCFLKNVRCDVWTPNSDLTTTCKRKCGHTEQIWEANWICFLNQTLSSYHHLHHQYVDSFRVGLYAMHGITNPFKYNYVTMESNAKDYLHFLSSHMSIKYLFILDKSLPIEMLSYSW